MSDYLRSNKFDLLVETAEGRFNLRRWIKRCLPTNLRIAVFGWRGSGKTTLVRYLQDRPLAAPGATVGREFADFEVQTVGRKSKPRRTRLVDHGGDFEPLFHKTLVEDHPDGVIFVVHHKNRDAHKKAWDHFCEFITTTGWWEPRAWSARRYLSAVLVLMNKRDVWGRKYMGPHLPNPDYVRPDEMKRLLEITRCEKELEKRKLKVLYGECSIREERGDDVDSAMIDFLRAILERGKRIQDVALRRKRIR